MLSRSLALCVLGVLLVVSACETPTAPSSAQRQYESLLRAPSWRLGAARDSTLGGALRWARSSSGFCCRGFRVAGSATEWTAIWDTLMLGLRPAPPPIPVDFATEMVVVALHGSAPTGGFSMTIQHVTRVRDTTFVLAQATRPDRECITTQAFTSPADARIVPRALPPTVLLIEARVFDCRTGTSRPDW